MLTDKERQEIWGSISHSGSSGNIANEYAIAIERAVLAKAMPIPKQELSMFPKNGSLIGSVITVITDQGKFKLDASKGHGATFINGVPTSGKWEVVDPLPAQAAAIPEHVTISQVPSSQYAQGWNDCVDIMLTASPKP